MLNATEQRTILAMADKISRAAVLVEQKRKGLFNQQGMQYTEAVKHQAELRSQLNDLLKEVG